MAKIYQRTVRETVERTEWVFSNAINPMNVSRDPSSVPIGGLDQRKEVENGDWQEVTDPLVQLLVKEIGKAQET